MKAKLILWMLLCAACCFGMERQAWKVDGETRAALVYMSEKAENPPLVFGFHGYGGTMRNAARSFRIHEVWPEAVVYMQRLPTPGQLTVLS